MEERYWNVLKILNTIYQKPLCSYSTRPFSMHSNTVRNAMEGVKEQYGTWQALGTPYNFINK